ncbi:MAG: hypothetical protein J5679_01000, partial [Alphaproteobacteria bacterium]|nr:hypothetical protein [Alphaproteobacteria bacterium]
GGDTTVAGTQLPDLELGDYTEYGISLEKNIEQFNISVSLNRRDGGRTGWTGELHMRYLF